MNEKSNINSNNTNNAVRNGSLGMEITEGSQCADKRNDFQLRLQTVAANMLNKRLQTL
jgi:hypothetical protein